MGFEAAAVEEGAREATAAALTEVVEMVAVAMVPQPLHS